MALIQADFFSKSLMRTTTINAIVPADKMGFDGELLQGNKPFKTLYLLHGIIGNYTDWVTGTRIQRWAQDKNLAVIMPSADNRFYVDNEAAGELFGNFIGNELVNTTRKLFHLSDKKEDTFIAGLSMGGYGAVINGLKYHNTFGYIGALSSAFILDSMVNSDNNASSIIGKRSYYESVFGDLSKVKGSDRDYKALINKLIEEKAEIPKIYMACGTDDFLIHQNRDYDQYLTQKGVDHTYVEGPGAHEWDFWDKYIKELLIWLPLEEEKQGVSSGNVI